MGTNLKSPESVKNVTCVGQKMKSTYNPLKPASKEHEAEFGVKVPYPFNIRSVKTELAASPTPSLVSYDNVRQSEDSRCDQEQRQSPFEILMQRGLDREHHGSTDPRDDGYTQVRTMAETRSSTDSICTCNQNNMQELEMECKRE